MIEVTHTPTAHDPNSYTIKGSSVIELLNECLKRIRPKSQAFYKKEIESDLYKNGTSIIDRHAGMGSFYTVILLT